MDDGQVPDELHQQHGHPSCVSARSDSFPGAFAQMYDPATLQTLLPELAGLPTP
jgi:hypothetical protein